MLTAARVIPASTSTATSDRRTGSSPRITGSARSRARRERPPEPGTVTSGAAVAMPGGDLPCCHQSAPQAYLTAAAAASAGRVPYPGAASQ